MRSVHHVNTVSVLICPLNMPQECEKYRDSGGPGGHDIHDFWMDDASNTRRGESCALLSRTVSIEPATRPVLSMIAKRKRWETTTIQQPIHPAPAKPQHTQIAAVRPVKLAAQPAPDHLLAEQMAPPQGKRLSRLTVRSLLASRSQPRAL
ncbi:hypothetical protein BH23CHL1_BH23CHL1_19880 [soil metagenome]